MLHDEGWSLKPPIHLLSQPFGVSSPPPSYLNTTYLYLDYPGYLPLLLKYIRAHEFYCTGTDLQWLPFFFFFFLFSQQNRIKSPMIKWQNDSPRIGVCYTITQSGATPVPWQYWVLQQRADTAHTGLLTKVPIWYLRVTENIFTANCLTSFFFF